MKKKYITPSSSSFSYIEALQPLCASNVKMQSTHNNNTGDAFSNETIWENNMWSETDEQD